MIYLDHNASSPLRPAALAAVSEALACAGNASSVHSCGRKARARIERARDAIASLVSCNPSEVVFTSGGSEANALALRGAVAGAAETGKRIARLMISAIEHDSVRANAAALADCTPGLKLQEIPVSRDGKLQTAALRDMLVQGKGRVLVSAMAANNETGVLQDVTEIARIVKQEGGPDALLHVDAVQAVGRVALPSERVDYISLSAHKLGGPQGAGALIIRSSAPFSAQIAGGGQELRRRAGTDNTAAISGFGTVAEGIQEIADAGLEGALRDRFERELRRIAPEAVIFGEDAARLPNTSNFAIPGLQAEIALIALDLEGIGVSSGAACSSGKVKPSHVLAAMGVPEDVARCAIRVSFGWTNREEDVDAIVESLRRLLARRVALAA